MRMIRPASALVAAVLTATALLLVRSRTAAPATLVAPPSGHGSPAAPSPTPPAGLPYPTAASLPSPAGETLAPVTTPASPAAPALTAPPPQPAHRYTRLLDGARLLEEKRAGLAGDRVRERRLYRTNERHPLILVERVLARGPAGQAVESEQAMVADHILVESELDEAQLAALNQRHGAEIRHHIPGSRVYLISFANPTPDTVAEAVAAYGKSAGPAQPDYVVHTTATPNDPSFSLLNGMHQASDQDIDAPEAWDYHTGSESVVLMVIDTGINYNHPDLAANCWVNPGEIAGNGLDDDGNGYVDDIRGYDFYNNDNNPLDDHGHGTHCAGTIGAVGNNGAGVAGVCWNVKMIAGKFIGASGYGYSSGAISAIYYATAKGVLLTSNSWGGGPFETLLNNAIADANAHGILFVAAAGNDSTNNEVNPFYPSSYAITNVIAVTATTAAGGQTYNYGATTVDLGAPGTSIYSTYNSGYAHLSGTSMATPHVSGAAALLKAARPDFTGAQIRSILLSTVQPLASLTGKCATGGRLNIGNAMLQTGISRIPASLAVTSTSANEIGLQWSDLSADESGFSLERRAGTLADAMDGSGGANHAYRVGSPSWVAESPGGFYTLSGGSHLRVPDANSLSSTSGGFSVSAWVKPATVANFIIAAKGTTITTLEWCLYYTSTGQLQFNVFDNAYPPSIGIKSTASFTADAGNWTHVTATFDGTGVSGLRLYRNGVQLTTTPSTYGSFLSLKNTSADLTIGAYRRDDAPTFGNGAVDSFRYYARPLSAGELTSLYAGGRNAALGVIAATGLNAFLDFNSAPAEWTALATLAANATIHTDTTVSPGTYYHYRVRAANASGNSGWSNTASTSTPGGGPAPSVPAAPSALAVTSSTASQVALGWTDNATDETSQEMERLAGFPDANPAYQVPDRSGANQHGYTMGSPTWNSDGSSGGHYSTASGKYLRVNDADALSFPSGGFSVSAWVKPSTVGNFIIAAKGTTISKLEWCLYYTTTGQIQFNVFDNGYPPSIGIKSTTAFLGDAGNWTHVTATFDGTGVSGLRLYRNGVQLATTPSTYGTFVSLKNTTADLTIGVYRRDDAPTYGTGAVDSFRLYGRTVSGAEVTTLFSAGRFAPRDTVSNTSLALFLDMDVPAPAWTPLVTLAANATIHTDTTVSPSTTYHYRVRATNASGSSAWSNTASTSTPAGGPAPALPAAPSALAVTSTTASQVALGWTDNATDETSQEMERLAGFPDANPAYQIPDRSGANQHGHTVGSPTWNNEGSSGGHYSIASGKYLRVNDSNALSFPSGGFSVSAWVKPSTVGNFIIAAKGTTISKLEWCLYYTTTGQIQFNVFDNGYPPSIGIKSTTAFLGDAGNWTHVTATFDGTGVSGLRLYRNGVQLATTPSTYGTFVSLKNTAADLTIGVYRRDDAPTYGTGAVDSFRLYGRNVSGAEVTTLFSAGRFAPRDTVSNTSLALFLDMDVPAPAWTPLATLAANATTHTDTAVSPGTFYHYRVRAANASGSSGWSNIASTTTLTSAAVVAGAEADGALTAMVGDTPAGQTAGDFTLRVSLATPAAADDQANRIQADGPELTWTSREGASYAVEFSPSLDHPFHRLAENIPATPPLNRFFLPDLGTHGFFRVEETR